MAREMSGRWGELGWGLAVARGEARGWRGDATGKEGQDGHSLAGYTEKFRFSFLLLMPKNMAQLEIAG